MSSLSEDEIRHEYQEQNQEYKNLCSDIHRLITKDFSTQGISLAFPIERRIKALDSIIDKHSRDRSQGGYKVRKSIDEIYDIIGLRIVVLYPEQKDLIIEQLSALFEGNVTVKEVGSSSAKEFSYTSSHLICRIPSGWQSPTWRTAENRKFEIQVRTLSEHIWATLSHDLFYKRENIPGELERELSKTKALLEITDDRISNIKQKVEDYSSRVENMPYEEVLNLKLDPSTFKRVVDKYCPGFEDNDDTYYVDDSFYYESVFDIKTTRLLDELVASMNRTWDTLSEFFQDLLHKVSQYHDEFLSNNEESQRDIFLSIPPPPPSMFPEDD